MPNAELRYSGCIMCAREQGRLNDDCVNLNHAHNTRELQIGGRRTRGRGRGRGRGRSDFGP